MPSASPDPAPSAPARRPAAERRDQILQAAREVCLAHGLAAARMDEIAARAHVSKGTLYNHFASKEDLLLAMMEERLQLGTDMVANAVAGETEPRAAFERTLEGMVELVAVQATTAPLLYQTWALVGDDASLHQRLYAALQRFFGQWQGTTRDILQAGQASGAFRRDADAEAFTQTLVDLVSGMIFRGTFDPEHVRPERVRASLRALVAHRLLEPSDAPLGDSE